MSNFSRNRGSGFYLNIVLCCLAVVLLVGILSNISRPGDDFTAGTEGTDATQGYSIKYYLTGVRILNDEVPSSAEAGETVILVFAPLEGYEFHLQAQNVVVKNASYTYSEESNGYHVLTLTDFVGDITVTITAAVVIPDPGEGFYPVMVDDYSCYEFVNVPEMMYPGKEYRIEARHLTDVDRSIPFYDSDSGYKIRAEQGNNVTYFYISDITANQDDYFLFIDTTHTHVVDVTTNLVGCTMSSDAFEYLHPGASDLIYLTPKTGYVLPASVSVTGGASVKSWNAQTGELIVLRTSLDDVRIECIATTIPSPDPDPVSYPLTFEISNASCFKSVDIPSTVSPGEEYSILLEHLSGNFKWYYVSEPTNCSFSYETVGNFTCFLISDVVGPVTINFAEHTHDISVTSTLTNCTISGSTGLEYHHVEDYAHFKVTASEGYVLPDTINVTGASIDFWNPETGALTLIIDSAADITIECAATQAFDITWNLVGCSTNDPDTPVRVDCGQVYGLKLSTGYVAFPDVADIRVEGAEWEWFAEDAELTLSNPTGPITVTIICEVESYSFYFKYNPNHVTADKARPLTVSPNDVIRLRFDCNADNVYFGQIQQLENCKYRVIDESSNNYLIIEVYDFTGDASLMVGSYEEFWVTHKLTNCTIDEDFSSLVTSSGSYYFVYEAEEGYTLPESISVTGVDGYEWLPAVGSLKIWGIHDDPVVTIKAVEDEQPEPSLNWYHIDVTATKSRTPALSTNPSSIREDQTVDLVFLSNQYVEFGSITVTNADSSYTIDGGVLTITIWNPTSTVKVTVGNYMLYPVVYTLENCSADELPGSMKSGNEYAIHLRADDGYESSFDVSVIGASYRWEGNTLILFNPTGLVTVEISCEAEEESVSYPLTFDLSNSSCFSSADIPAVVFTGIENVITLEHGHDDIVWSYVSDSANCSMTYETVGGVTYFYITDVTGPVNINFVEHVHDVDITWNLTNCYVSGNNHLEYNHYEDTVTFTLIADSGYGLPIPTDISVTGASSYEYDEITGKLKITIDSNDPVIVTIEAVRPGHYE